MTEKVIELRIKRTFAAARDKVFLAWTDPEELRKWWGIEESYTTPIAEVDLRLGGRYRLGMKAPDGDEVLIVGGTYLEIEPPERLVYTWAWESAGPGAPETLVEVEFRDLGGSTEVVLTHQRFPNRDSRKLHLDGWVGCLEQLARVVEASPGN